MDIVMLLQDLGKETAVDAIANYILQNPDVEDLIAAKMASMLSDQQISDLPATPTNTDKSNSAHPRPTTSSFAEDLSFYSRPQLQASYLFANFKMIFVVNMDLNMGRGKQCAQVAHATLGLCLQMKESSNSELMAKANQWLFSGQKKIVVRGNNLNHLLTTKKAAEEAKLPCFLVADAGCTQIAPGSRTVLAVFGSDEELDPITGSLKLL